MMFSDTTNSVNDCAAQSVIEHGVQHHASVGHKPAASLSSDSSLMIQQRYRAIEVANEALASQVRMLEADVVLLESNSRFRYLHNKYYQLRPLIMDRPALVEEIENYLGTYVARPCFDIMYTLRPPAPGAMFDIVHLNNSLSMYRQVLSHRLRQLQTADIRYFIKILDEIDGASDTGGV